MLKGYYLQLRAAAAASPGSLPVTARQLESLVRLSEARARAELREWVTREDAEVGGQGVGTGAACVHPGGRQAAPMHRPCVVLGWQANRPTKHVELLS